ncbi:MAG: hypothetical protein ACREQ9_03300 [Candidatus Binatia bacterium]
MSYPPSFGALTTENVHLGRRLFRSWIFAFGLLPIDYDDVIFAEFEPGRRFLERSSLLTQREWIHERTIEGKAAGSTLVDRIRFVPRLRLLGPFHLLVFRLSFRLRHRNLARIFGSP